MTASAIDRSSGCDVMGSTVEPSDVETKGNGSASRFQDDLTKADVVRCLQAAIESFLAARTWSRDRLAEDICGVSTSYFSKLTNLEQGDAFGFIYEKLPPEIRKDFLERLVELERLDPFVLALEQLMVACLRVVRTGRSYRLPARADRMAAAADHSKRKKEVA